MIEQLIVEATECDFKVALEIKKPKSWLKSVSSFSNGIGGTSTRADSIAGQPKLSVESLKAVCPCSFR